MPNPETKPPKVLIAENNAAIAMTLRELLSLIGLEVVGVAASVNDALCLAQNTKPDLAIFDARLEGRRDGIEGAALLREIVDIPVVFLTAQGDKEMNARVEDLNPASHLRKPLGSQEIVAAVEIALGRSIDQLDRQAPGGLFA